MAYYGPSFACKDLIQFFLGLFTCEFACHHPCLLDYPIDLFGRFFFAFLNVKDFQKIMDKYILWKTARISFFFFFFFALETLVYIYPQVFEVPSYAFSKNKLSDLVTKVGSTLFKCLTLTYRRHIFVSILTFKR